MKSLKKDIITIDRRRDAHGWIQWQGTDVCIDIHCTCGNLSHYDGGFMFFIKCPACGRIYEANGHVELIKTDENEVETKGNIQLAE